jgi:hypothetical protein
MLLFFTNKKMKHIFAVFTIAFIVALPVATFAQNGGLYSPNASYGYTLPDGSTSPGGIILPDGTLVLPDGTSMPYAVVMPDGTLLLPDGTTMPSTLTLPDERTPQAGGMSGTGTPELQVRYQTNAVSCSQDFDTVTGIINYVTCSISNSFIPILVALALLVFFYGVVRYVIAGDGSDDREEGRWFMIYGIIGLFVMVSVWGLVSVISNTFDIGTSFPPQFTAPE